MKTPKQIARADKQAAADQARAEQERQRAERVREGWAEPAKFPPVGRPNRRRVK